MGERSGRRTGPRTLRADAQRNRALVLEAAWRLLKTRGPEGLSVEEIARDAGIGKGTFYRHYPSYQCLFEALVAQGSAWLAAAMHERIPPEADAPTKLRAVVALVYDAYEKQGIDLAVLLNAWRLADADPQRGPRGEQESPHPIAVLLARVRGILEQGVREGSFRPLDLDYTSVAVFSLISPMTFVKQREHLGYGRAELEERVVDLLVHALRRDGGGRREW
jgi:AcrR family transcriptional regulator